MAHTRDPRKQRGTPGGRGHRTTQSADRAARPPARRTTRQERRSLETRQRLLEAARAVFAKRGMDLTTIDEITNRADVGKGTFYYYFKSKGGLIRELVRDMLGELIATIDEQTRGNPDLRELLDNLIGAHIAFFSRRWEDFVLYFQGRADQTLIEGYEGIETPFLEYLQKIEGLIDDAVQYHLPRPVLRRIACAVAGFVSGYYSFAAIASEDKDVDKAFRSLRGAMVASLARFIKEAIPAAEKHPQ